MRIVTKSNPPREPGKHRQSRAGGAVILFACSSRLRKGGAAPNPARGLAATRDRAPNPSRRMRRRPPPRTGRFRSRGAVMTFRPRLPGKRRIGMIERACSHGPTAPGRGRRARVNPGRDRLRVRANRRLCRGRPRAWLTAASSELPDRADTDYGGVAAGVPVGMPNVLKVRLHSPTRNDLSDICQFEICLEVANRARFTGECDLTSRSKARTASENREYMKLAPNRSAGRPGIETCQIRFRHRRRNRPGCGPTD